MWARFAAATAVIDRSAGPCPAAEVAAVRGGRPLARRRIGGQLHVRLSREKRPAGRDAAHRRPAVPVARRWRDAGRRTDAPTRRSSRRCGPASTWWSRRAPHTRPVCATSMPARRRDGDRRRRFRPEPAAVMAVVHRPPRQTVFQPPAGAGRDAATRPSPAPASPRPRRWGRALRRRLGAKPALDLWASPTGGALQTLAVIAEHLAARLARARTDPAWRDRHRRMGAALLSGRRRGDGRDRLDDEAALFKRGRRRGNGMTTHRAHQGGWTSGSKTGAHAGDA